MKKMKILFVGDLPLLMPRSSVAKQLEVELYFSDQITGITTLKRSVSAWKRYVR